MLCGELEGSGNLALCGVQPRCWGLLSVGGEWGSPARLVRELQGLWGFVLSNLSVGRSQAGETRLYCEVLER